MKGGVFGFLVYGLATLALIPFGTGHDAWFPYWFYPTMVGSLPLSILFHWISGGKDYMDEAGFIFPIITYVFFGVIVGLIYSKIKNRKIVQPSSTL